MSNDTKLFLQPHKTNNSTKQSEVNRTELGKATSMDCPSRNATSVQHLYVQHQETPSANWVGRPSTVSLGHDRCLMSENFAHKPLGIVVGMCLHHP
jgi:hypothetical protein